MSSTQRRQAMLLEDEGFRAMPYQDSQGKRTVGTGFNIEEPFVAKMIPKDVILGKRGLSKQENESILSALLTQAEKDAVSFVGSEDAFNTLTDGQKDTLVNLSYQLGLAKLSGFQDMQSAIRTGDMDTAAAEMMDSKAARQTPNRFRRNLLRFKGGK